MTDIAAADPAGPKGIGGWLILPALGTFISIALNVYAAYQSIQALQSLSTQTGQSVLAFFVWVELFCQLAIGAGWIYAAVLLLRHKRRFPMTFVVLLLITLLFNILDTAIAALMFNAPLMPDDIKTLGRSVVACAVWIPYMFRSKRVQNTFID